MGRHVEGREVQKVGEAVQVKTIEIAYRGEKSVPSLEKQSNYEEWNDEKCTARAEQME